MQRWPFNKSLVYIICFHKETKIDCVSLPPEHSHDWIFCRNHLIEDTNVKMVHKLTFPQRFIKLISQDLQTIRGNSHVNNRSSPGSLLYSGNSACTSHRCTVATSAAQYNIPSLNLTIFTSNIQFATVFEEFRQKIIGFTCIKLINFPSAATRWGFLRNVTRRSRPLMCKALLEEKHFD